MKVINNYIAKSFLVKFLQICLGFSLMIFFINLIDVLDKIRGSESPFYSAILMAFLQIPDFLNDITASLVLISAIITFFTLSSRSEITIMRSGGFSLWQILQPITISAFLLGIFWITIFGPISTLMMKKFIELETRYVKEESREVIEPENGIWLKQDNIEKPNEELIIQAKKVYKENLELNEVSIWFFDQNGKFYKKIDADKMLLKEKFWLLENVISNDNNLLNKTTPTLTIPTNLEPDFITEKIVNNFQNVKLFSLFELPNLIKDLSASGFASTKFKIYLHSLLNKPFLFMAMALIACYFGINHIRNQNSIIMIFIGVSAGLALYISSTIINALGASGLISIFASTWVITIICLAIGTLLIYKKENL